MASNQYQHQDTINMKSTLYDTVSLSSNGDDLHFGTSRSKRLKRKLSKKSSITLCALFFLSFSTYLSYKVLMTKHILELHQANKSHTTAYNEEQIYNTLFRNFKFVDDLKSGNMLGSSIVSSSNANVNDKNTNNNNDIKDDSSSAQEGLIYLDNPKAYSLLIESVGSFHQYFAYNSRGFDVQINQAFCGLATAATVLNSLRSVITVPEDPMYSPYHYATQNDLINTCVSAGSIPSSESVLSPPYGITLSQVNILLNCWLPKKEGWTVKANYVTNQSNKKFIKRELIKVLNGGTSRVLINYNRQMLGQIGGGHFSPLVAYNAKEDLFLIDDVAKYKYPPVFVPFDRIYDAMQTIDSCGTWNFPNGQSKVDASNITSTATSSTDSETLELIWKDIKNMLGCEEKFRGFITINKK